MSNEKVGKIVVIRLRGQFNIEHGIASTLKMLRLDRKHSCSVFDATASIQGMLHKVKDYVTFGDLDDETFKLLLTKRGQPYNGPLKDRKEKISYNRFLEVDSKKYKRYFRLSPPKGGFEKGGIKQQFGKKGALGNRKEKINDLIRRMV